MLEHLSENGSQIVDGLLFGLGVLAIYLGAVFTAAMVRSLGGAGSVGLTIAGRYMQGWFDYLRGDDRNTVNVTLNMVVDGHLKFETLVADRRIWYVWPNAYRMQMIRRAARRTTPDNPVVLFPDRPRRPRSFFGRLRHRWELRIHALVTSSTVVENGRSQRVRLVREDDYKATYGPLISLVSEKCNNDNALDLALGRPMEEYRFVIALTFEKLNSRRARHLRAMVMWEEALRNLPPMCPRVDFDEHRTRFRTLQAIARQYAERPECFGVVKVWRPRAIPDRVLAPAIADTISCDSTGTSG
jgi:hypothetical protein